MSWRDISLTWPYYQTHDGATILSGVGFTRDPRYDRYGSWLGQKRPKQHWLPGAKSTTEQMVKFVPFSDLCAAQKALIPRHAPNKNDGACRASSEREKRHAAVSAPIRAVKSARSLHPSFSGLAAPQRAPE
jgi:hypothetical protein